MSPRAKKPATKAAPAKADAKSVIAEIRAMGSEKNRAGMGRFGINTERAFGVSIAQLRPLARRYRRNHELAAALWASGWHEARLLACFVDDPKQVTKKQMDAWAAEFDSWDLCDQACLKLFVRTPFVDQKIARWAKDKREFVRRAGFALLAAHAVHGKDVPDPVFRGYLALIEKASTDERNFVRKAVNWALRQVGKRSASLHKPALALAKRLAASSDKTARWIGKDAVKELTDPFQLGRLRPK
jgi:3-methyladenine DNA glycosylase AlkD